MADSELLKAADQLDLWSSRATWISAFLALAMAVLGLLALWLHDQAQAKRREAERAALQAEGLDNPLWLQSERELSKSGFRRRDLADGLVLFQRQPEQAADGVPVVEAVIRRNGQTVAVADIVALDARNEWAWASSDEMSDGTPIAEAITNSRIPVWLAQRSTDGLDVIGVGIASSATRTASSESPQPPPQTDLVARRATQLVTHLRAAAGFVTSRPVRYWTLELGSAQTKHDYNSPPERRQRAAIIVALSRRMNADDGPISPEEALALITTNVDAYGTNLRDFTNSATPRVNELP